MLGIKNGTAANASLLGNFEIVATTLIALLLFRERVSAKLWTAVFLIAAASALLSFEGDGSLRFSGGSALVLLATVCWGLENNCTRKISDKSTYQIVTVKGLCSGFGSLITAFIIGESFPAIRYILPVMALGFVSYGLSIFMYVRAQRELGAAKTSAYYAAAPFIGAFLGFMINGEKLTSVYLCALAVMLVGTAFVVYDTMRPRRT
jgi:drug/metabolite transporter (DMT)-like permease